MRHVLTGLVASVLLAGCGFLSTSPPQPPGTVELPRNVPLTPPESTIANLQEAFRVGSAAAYMRSIQDSTATDPVHFTAEFSPTEALELGNGISDPAVLALLNGGWHEEQERNAMNSVMSTIDPQHPSANRFTYTLVKTADLEYRIYYVASVSLGSLSQIKGSADLKLHLNATGNYKISLWRDFPDSTVGRPTRSYFGALRFINRTQ